MKRRIVFMSDAHLIECGEIAAGLAIAADGGFVFFSSETMFDSLHGETFENLADLERTIARFMIREKRSGVPQRGARAASTLPPWPAAPACPSVRNVLVDVARSRKTPAVARRGLESRGLEKD